MMITLHDIGEMIAGSAQRAPWGWALLATILITLIKVWPIINLQVITARAKLRQEKRDHLNDCEEQLAELRGKLDGAIERIHNIEMRLVGTVTAYRILEVEVDAGNPLSPALAQARAVFREVWDTFSPMTAEIAEAVDAVRKIN